MFDGDFADRTAFLNTLSVEIILGRAVWGFVRQPPLFIKEWSNGAVNSPFLVEKHQVILPLRLIGKRIGSQVSE